MHRGLQILAVAAAAVKFMFIVTIVPFQVGSHKLRAMDRLSIIKHIGTSKEQIFKLNSLPHFGEFS